jgi:hypothetical protein
MRVIRGMAAAMGGAIVAATVLAASASGAVEKQGMAPKRQVARALGGFTPAAGDPRLAALFARAGFASGFRFTPAETRADSRAVTVAVRARNNNVTDPGRVAVADAGTTIGLAPIAYSMGASVGWRRLALSGDVARVDLAGLGGREAADVALSYTAPRWSGRVKAQADRALDDTPRAIADLPSYSLDVGGSYSLTRNLDVTAGVRYRTDRERLARLDDRRDSQGVYVGTAFRF